MEAADRPFLSTTRIQSYVNFLINVPITTCFRHKRAVFRAPVSFFL